ncbi:hypothetical protein D3C72_1028270 [compost metagenome]
MDFIDKKDVVRFQVGQHRRQIARLFQHRPGGGAQVNAHFIGNDVGQRGFPQPGRAEDQQMVQSVATLLGSLNKDFHLLADMRLTDILRQQLRPDGAIKNFFFIDRLGRNQAIGFNHSLPLIGAYSAARSASRIRVSQSAPGLAILLTMRLASCGL